jgi:hypothetical protein
MRRVLLGLLILMSLGTPAQAAWPNDPLAFALDNKTIYQPVDFQTWCGDCVGVDYTTQEPWVINPTTCMWDSDDEFTYRGAGVLEGTAGFTECLLRSERQNLTASTRLSSPAGSLVLTYSFTWDTGSLVVPIPAVWNPASHRYDYNACIQYPFPSTGSVFEEVPESHGGHAVSVAVEFTMTNPGQKVGKTGGAVSFGIIPYAVSC